MKSHAHTFNKINMHKVQQYKRIDFIKVSKYKDKWNDQVLEIKIAVMYVCVCVCMLAMESTTYLDFFPGAVYPDKTDAIGISKILPKYVCVSKDP